MRRPVRHAARRDPFTNPKPSLTLDETHRGTPGSLTLTATRRMTGPTSDHAKAASGRRPPGRQSMGRSPGETDQKPLPKRTSTAPACRLQRRGAGHLCAAACSRCCARRSGHPARSHRPSRPSAMKIGGDRRATQDDRLLRALLKRWMPRRSYGARQNAPRTGRVIHVSVDGAGSRQMNPHRDVVCLRPCNACLRQAGSIAPGSAIV